MQKRRREIEVDRDTLPREQRKVYNLRGEKKVTVLLPRKRGKHPTGDRAIKPLKGLCHSRG